jgi:hypothetical protein
VEVPERDKGGCVYEGHGRPFLPPVRRLLGRKFSTKQKDNYTMFERRAPNRKPEALAEFKQALDKAIEEARFYGVDLRIMADQLEQRANAQRVVFATVAPHGQAL